LSGAPKTTRAPRTIIVTGGAGFIGSNFVRMILPHSSLRVVVFDKLTYAGSRLNLRSVEAEPGYLFVRGDIADRCAVEALMARFQPDAIVNFAAETHVDRSIDGPRSFLRTNVDGTFELLEAARQYWSRLEPVAREGFRLLHVSTDEVFGSLGAEGSFREDAAYAPNSPYSASKASSDHFARAYFQTYSLPVLVTNCSNNYGYFQFPEKLIPLTILNAVAGRDIPIYGDGGNLRDWLFVEDHCEGIRVVLERGRVGESYNIGGNCERSNLEVVAEVASALEESMPAALNPALAARGMETYLQLIELVQDRPGHDRRYAIDCSRIERELGWTPRTGFSAGMRATVSWYLKNLKWCAGVQNGNYRGQRLGLAPAADAR
jgi:dTDP-glucose 4,6-dehydratase